MTNEKLFAGSQERYPTFNPATLKERDEDGKRLPVYKTAKREVSEEV